MQNSTENTIIYQETNPYASMTAYIEDDGRTVYLYLQSQYNPNYPMQSVWLKNRITAPDSTDFSMGMAPVLSKSEILDPDNTEPILPEDIYFIWLEEGNGVALFLKDELYAFLPPWSGIDGFHGYCAKSKSESVTAYPLGDPNHGVIADRVQSARNFWEFRSDSYSWSKIQTKRLNFLESVFGKHTLYWSADGGNFPYIGLAKFRPKQYKDISIYSTIGMSGQNMPCVELFVKNYTDVSKTELLIAIFDPEGNLSDDFAPHVLGELVKYPWNMLNWFGEGHSISISKKDPLSTETDYDHVVFIQQPSFSILDFKIIAPPEINSLKAEDNIPVNFLFLLPIIEEEKVLLMEQGYSKFKELAEQKKLGWFHRSNRESIL